MEHNKAKIVYECGMAILALFAVILAVADLLGKIPLHYYKIYLIIDTAILAIFALDYFIRLLRSHDKKTFFRENIFNLISIVPFNSLFRALRFVRLFRLLRLIKLVKALLFFRRLNHRTSQFFRTNGFIYILYATVVSILIGSLFMYLLPGEPAIDSYADAIWWSFVTTTTVGYGDISPDTGAGRVVAVFLMLIGIGFISMLTGTIATYFLNKVSPTKYDKDRQLDLSDLSEEEYKTVEDFVAFLRSKKNGN